MCVIAALWGLVGYYTGAGTETLESHFNHAGASDGRQFCLIETSAGHRFEESSSRLQRCCGCHDIPAKRAEEFQHVLDFCRLD